MFARHVMFVLQLNKELEAIERGLEPFELDVASASQVWFMAKQETDGFRSLSEEQLLAFVHIAKTAGTSFGKLLGTQVFRRHTCGVYQGTSISSAQCGTGVYEPEYAAELLMRAKTSMSVNVFGSKFAIPRKKKISVINGHMRYGIHKFLAEPVSYITFVRDPVSRVVSAYNYVRKMGFMPLETPISDFIDGDFLGNSNAMVRQLVHDDTLDTK